MENSKYGNNTITANQHNFFTTTICHTRKSATIMGTHRPLSSSSTTTARNNRTYTTTNS